MRLGELVTLCNADNSGEMPNWSHCQEMQHLGSNDHTEEPLTTMFQKVF